MWQDPRLIILYFLLNASVILFCTRNILSIILFLSVSIINILVVLLGLGGEFLAPVIIQIYLAGVLIFSLFLVMMLYLKGASLGVVIMASLLLLGILAGFSLLPVFKGKIGWGVKGIPRLDLVFLAIIFLFFDFIQIKTIVRKFLYIIKKFI
jgi:hypothetical protein